MAMAAALTPRAHGLAARGSQSRFPRRHSHPRTPSSLHSWAGLVPGSPALRPGDPFIFVRDRGSPDGEGGEVTWHGPGQIVAYPVLDLNFHKKDLHWYLRQLEEVVIRVLGRYGLEGERETEHTGVWVGGAKVAAIGLNASRWVTSHGFALNVDPDLRAFEAIVPCGIQGRPVTRLCDLVGAATGSSSFPEEIKYVAVAEGIHGAGVTATKAAATADMGFVRALVMQEFEGVFGVSMEVVDVDAATHRGDDLKGRSFRQTVSRSCWRA